MKNTGRRLLSLLLVLVLAAGMMPVSAHAAGVCTHEGTGRSYVSNGDGSTHKVVCTAEGCGATVTATQTCSGGSFTSAGGSGHSKSCQHCGQSYAADTHDGNSTYTQDPTCTIAGKTVPKCSVCGYCDTSAAGTPINPTGHDFQSGSTYQTITPAKCVETGLEGKVCANGCGTVSQDVTQPIPVLGHDFTSGTAYTVITPASCTTKGVEHKKCARCEATDSTQAQEIDALGHDFTGGSWISAGETEHIKKCARCDATDAETKAACTYSESTTAPTCCTAGETVKTCTVCGDIKKTPLAATGDHTYAAEWTSDDTKHWKAGINGCLLKDAEAVHIWIQDPDQTDVAATCAAEGTKYEKCGTCGKTRTVTLDKPDHDWTDWTPDGTRHSRTCKNTAYCSAKESLDHTKGTLKSTETPATCTAEGVGTYLCTSCGGEFSDSIDKLPHTQSAARDSVKTPATHTAGGVDIYKCTECNAPLEVATQAIPDHIFSKEWSHNAQMRTHYHACTVSGCTEIADEGGCYGTKSDKTPATCMADGQAVVICEVCKTTLDTIRLPKLPHNFGDAEMTYNATTGMHSAAECLNEGCSVTEAQACHFMETFNDTHHWQECTYGGHTAENKIRGKADHNLVRNNDLSHHWTSCQNCSYHVQEEHTFTEKAATAPTCLRDGNKAYRHCSGCNKDFYLEEGVLAEVTDPGQVILPKDVTLPATHKNLVKIQKKAATCHATGVSQDYFRCKDCGMCFLPDTKGKPSTVTAVETELVTPILTHVFSELNTTTPSQHQYVCKLCGDAAAAENHTWGTGNKCTVCKYHHIHTAKYTAATATCADPGLAAFYSCTSTVCPQTGKHYSDNDLTKEIAVDAPGTQLTGHVHKTVAKVDATCKTPGMEAHKYCAACKLYFTEADVLTTKEALTIAKLTTHTPAETWSYDYTGHWHTCTVCGEKADTAAVHTRGLDGKCNDCPYDLDHVCATADLVKKEGKPATCTENGVATTYICKECKRVYAKNDAKTLYVPATHDPKAAHRFQTAWEMNDTQHWHACKNCDTGKGSEMPHNFTNGVCACGYNVNVHWVSRPAGKLDPNEYAAFVSSAERKDLVSVKVDGSTLSEGSHYTVGSGSTIITLQPRYLKTLEGGVPHTLTIRSKTGSVSTTFTVEGKMWQNLYFPRDVRTKYLGAPKFTNPLVHDVGDGTITYSSSNEKVAVVDSTGKVTIKRTGTCTITAYASETKTYEAASASYILRVYETNDNPKTADALNPALLVLTLSAASLAVLLLCKRRML